MVVDAFLEIRGAGVGCQRLCRFSGPFRALSFAFDTPRTCALGCILAAARLHFGELDPLVGKIYGRMTTSLALAGSANFTPRS